MNPIFIENSDDVAEYVREIEESVYPGMPPEYNPYVEFIPEERITYDDWMERREIEDHLRAVAPDFADLQDRTMDLVAPRLRRPFFVEPPFVADLAEEDIFDLCETFENEMNCNLATLGPDDVDRWVQINRFRIYDSLPEWSTETQGQRERVLARSAQRLKDLVSYATANYEALYGDFL